MGCGSSKSTFNTVDDSVHVMLKHDKKVQQNHGEAPHGYVPRAEHPLLRRKDGPAETAVSSATATNTAATRTSARMVVAQEEDDDDVGLNLSN